VAGSGPEHLQVRLPLVDSLIKLGWQGEQLQWKPEWKVPKAPSEASKRDLGRRFDGFPADLVIFDDAAYAGDFDHVLVIFETKKPNATEGITQLKIYLNLEPAARLGVWTNGTEVARVYRAADGTFKEDRTRGLPSPRESFLLSGDRLLTWNDLEQPSAKKLKDTFQRILDSVVARDSKSTRRDDQLNELCNMLLAKLESDKAAKVEPNEPVSFQFREDELRSADAIRREFRGLRAVHSDLFDLDDDTEIHLSDHTIGVVAYEFGSLRLFDAPMDVMSHAFQVFRAASLKSEEGQYFTPYAVIRSVAKLMEVKPRDVVIDPACGTGGFLMEAFRSLTERYPNMDAGDAKQWAQRHLFGIDRDRINVKLTKAMMLILGDGSTHTFRADSLSTHRWRTDYPQVAAAVRDGTFTLIMTNPPFGEKLTFLAREARLAQYTISRSSPNDSDHVEGTGEDTASTSGIKYKDREVGLVFLERCYRLLQPGGRLGIILPETYFFSKSYLWLQDWVAKRFTTRAVINIPMEAFQGFCRAKTNFYIFEKRP
jgi:type I restriction-modification system DNA methylase subunit